MTTFNEMKDEPKKVEVVRDQKRSSTKHTSNGKVIENAEEKADDSIHCRNCTNLRLTRIPGELNSNQFATDVVNAQGKTVTVKMHRIAGNLVAVCGKKRWGENLIASPKQVVDKLSPYFRTHAALCDDFEKEEGQVGEIVDAIYRDDHPE